MKELAAVGPAKVKIKENETSKCFLSILASAMLKRSSEWNVPPNVPPKKADGTSKQV